MRMTIEEKFRLYLETLKGNFTKIARLDFLNPDGGVAFSLDNNPFNRRSRNFLQEGSTLTCNLNNGRRRQATIKLANLDGEFEYAYNKLWVGSKLKLYEGLILPNGEEFYLPQGEFGIENPEEAIAPNGKTATLHLVDKWCWLDGTLGGNLEGVYGVDEGSNIFDAIQRLLKLDRYTNENNGPHPIDPVKPLFTSYYNGKTQLLTDGTTVNLIDMPHDFRSSDTGTFADVILGLCEILAAWVGYNQLGRLVVDPSQDDILDANKPVQWEFKEGDGQLQSVNYGAKPAEMFNDLIVVGATSDTARTARARAQNLDPSSDTCISRIGLKTKRMNIPNYYADDICAAFAEWTLKRKAVMSKTVNIKCTQMFHIVENQIIRLQRVDKPGKPIERHLVTGFTRPIGQTGPMTIEAVSVHDFPTATIVRSDASVIEFVFVSEDGNKRKYKIKMSDGKEYDVDFTVDGETGILTQNKPDGYAGPDFTVSKDGHLEVIGR